MGVTIKDVAAHLGISASTVSRAFSRPEKVDTSTREQVMAAAEQLGYRPNRAAQALNTGRTGCIGAIVPDLENPFFAGMLKGIEQAADELGYQTLVADSGEHVAAEARAAEALTAQVDGLLLCATRLEEEDILRVDRNRRVVLVNRTAGNLPHVSFDSRSGMREAIRHLAALGHRRIGYAGGDLISRSARQRLRAFEDACREAAPDIEPVLLGEFNPTFEGGGPAADAALTAEITAVVVYNDIMAIGLTHRLLSYGLTLPERLSIIGCDDVPISAMISPPLTTVSLPRREAGRMAVEVLHAVIGGAEGGGRPASVVLPGRLVVRQSTAALGG